MSSHSLLSLSFPDISMSMRACLRTGLGKDWSPSSKHLFNESISERRSVIYSLMCPTHLPLSRTLWFVSQGEKERHQAVPLLAPQIAHRKFVTAQTQLIMAYGRRNDRTAPPMPYSAICTIIIIIRRSEKKSKIRYFKSLSVAKG